MSRAADSVTFPLTRIVDGTQGPGDKATVVADLICPFRSFRWTIGVSEPFNFKHKSLPDQLIEQKPPEMIMRIVLPKADG